MWAKLDDLDSAEALISHGHHVEVFVQEVGSEEVHRFNIIGDIVPEYTAIDV